MKNDAGGVGENCGCGEENNEGRGERGMWLGENCKLPFNTDFH